MNDPVLIQEDSFQVAWAKAVNALSENQWELWDLVVRIRDVSAFGEMYNSSYEKHAQGLGLLTPKQVAYTICPYDLAHNRSFAEMRHMYIERFYPKLRKLPHAGWGTYFHRMVAYPVVDSAGEKSVVDQLGNIIATIAKSNRVCRAAYTMEISIPGGENTRPLGAPCLNTLAVRQEPMGKTRLISLLAVYRNHDFLERAYGNYYGLCKLIELVARETGSKAGSLTCVSSHAFVDKMKTPLKDFISKHDWTTVDV